MDNGWNKRGIIKFLVHAIAVVSIAWFCVWGFGKSMSIAGQSMEPTLNPGETVILDRITYKFKEPERYDVIAYFMEDFEANTVDDMDEDDVVPEITIKRVIGLPGETILISDGKIYVNGTALSGHDDLDKANLAGIASEPVELKDNEYFVLGDNRKASEDSRYEKIGNIAKYRILGKVWYRTLPFKEAGKIK